MMIKATNDGQDEDQNDQDDQEISPSINEEIEARRQDEDYKNH